MLLGFEKSENLIEMEMRRDLKQNMKEEKRRERDNQGWSKWEKSVNDP